MQLVPCREDYAHDFVWRRDTRQDLVQPVFLQLLHPVGLRGVADVIQRSTAHDQLGYLVVHPHERVDSKAPLIPRMTAGFAALTSAQGDLLVRGLRPETKPP